METSVNNKCKAFTSLEQSRKLAEFLPIESADMCFNISQRTNMPPLMTPYCKFKEFFNMGKTPDFLIPCWSLAALLSVIKPINENTYTIRGTLDGGAIISFDEATSVMFQEEEIIDAVFEMVVWLKEIGKL